MQKKIKQHNNVMKSYIIERYLCEVKRQEFLLWQHRNTHETLQTLTNNVQVAWGCLRA